MIDDFRHFRVVPNPDGNDFVIECSVSHGSSWHRSFGRIYDGAVDANRAALGAYYRARKLRETGGGGDFPWIHYWWGAPALNETSGPDLRGLEANFQVYRGQYFTMIDVVEHERLDGTSTLLGRWISKCASCGEQFTFLRPVKAKTLQPNRRCEKHKRPGRRVKTNG